MEPGEQSRDSTGGAGGSPDVTTDILPEFPLVWKSLKVAVMTLLSSLEILFQKLILNKCLSFIDPLLVFTLASEQRWVWARLLRSLVVFLLGSSVLLLLDL